MTDRELLELLVDKVTNMDGRIANIEVKQDAMGEKIANIEAKQNIMDEKISNIEQKQNIIIEQTAFLLEYKTDSNAKIVDLDKRVRQNTIDIAVIKKTIVN